MADFHEARAGLADAKVEKDHVHAVYDAIASHFSSTRYKVWVGLRVKTNHGGPLQADVGCGNGKYLGINPEHTVGIGSDTCANLVTISGERGHEGLVADLLTLPYRNSSFVSGCERRTWESKWGYMESKCGGLQDAVICIAVVHHMASPARRLAALKELGRIVKPGGSMLVYVWAKEQEKFQNSSVGADGDLFVPWKLQRTFIKKDENEKEINEKEDIVYQRYYHLFTEGELEALVDQVGGLTVREAGCDHGNWWVMATRS